MLNNQTFGNTMRGMCQLNSKREVSKKKRKTYTTPPRIDDETFSNVHILFIPLKQFKLTSSLNNLNNFVFIHYHLS